MEQIPFVFQRAAISGLNVNSFNAVRFLLVTVLVIPFFERSVSRFMRLLATVKLLRGGTVHWRNVKAGYWMMHMGYFNRKSMMGLIFASVIMTAVYMMMELGIDTCRIPQFSQVRARDEEMFRTDWMVTNENRSRHYDIMATLLATKSEFSLESVLVQAIGKPSRDRGTDFTIQVLPLVSRRCPPGLPVYRANDKIRKIIGKSTPREIAYNFTYKRFRYEFKLDKSKKGLKEDGSLFRKGPTNEASGFVVVHGAFEQRGVSSSTPVINSDSVVSLQQFKNITGANALITQAILPFESQRITQSIYKQVLQVLGGACVFRQNDGGVCLVPRRQLMQQREGIKWKNITSESTSDKCFSTGLRGRDGTVVLRDASGYYNDGEQYHQAKCVRSEKMTSVDTTFDLVVAHDLLRSVKGKGCQAGALKTIAITNVIASVTYDEGFEVTTAEMEAMLEERRWHALVENRIVEKMSADEVSDLLVRLVAVSTRRAFVRDRFVSGNKYVRDMLMPCIARYYLVLLGLIILLFAAVELGILLLQVMDKRFHIRQDWRLLKLLTRASLLMVGDNYHYAVAKISDSMKESDSSGNAQNQGIALHLTKTSGPFYQISLSEAASSKAWDLESEIKMEY